MGGQCVCGGPVYAKEMCRRCYNREYWQRPEVRDRARAHPERWHANWVERTMESVRWNRESARRDADADYEPPIASDFDGETAVASGHRPGHMLYGVDESVTLG
jgi:hypothetical protein